MRIRINLIFICLITCQFTFSNIIYGQISFQLDRLVSNDSILIYNGKIENGDSKLLIKKKDSSYQFTRAVHGLLYVTKIRGKCLLQEDTITLLNIENKCSYKKKKILLQIKFKKNDDFLIADREEYFFYLKKVKKKKSRLKYNRRLGDEYIIARCDARFYVSRSSKDVFTIIYEDGFVVRIEGCKEILDRTRRNVKAGDTLGRSTKKNSVKYREYTEVSLFR